MSGMGRRMTDVTIRPQMPLPSSRSRPKYGTRPLLMRSPRIASVAGRNVRLPMTDTKTTPIVPTAIEVKSGRSPDVHPGMVAFAEAFKPQRTLLVGGDGIALEEFLSQPVEHWIAR